MVKREVPVPIVFEVNLPYTALQDVDCQLALGRAFLCHILYMRGLIRAPFSYMNVVTLDDGFFPTEETGSKCARGRSQRVKVARTRAAYMQLFTDLARVFQDIPVSKLSLMLGATAVHPRETYTLHFLCDTASAHAADVEAAPVSNDTRTHQTCMRQLVRNMVMRWAEVPITSSRRLSTFIAVKPRGGGDGSGPSNTTSPASGGPKFYPSLAYKPSFKVKTCKRGIPAMHVLVVPRSNEIDHGNGENCEYGGDSEFSTAAAPAAWYVSRKGIKAVV